MELPFLKPKKVASVIIMSKKKADSPAEPVSEEGEETAELLKASEDILKAIVNKDAKALAQAFNNAYMALEKEEHESENE